MIDKIYCIGDSHCRFFSKRNIPKENYRDLHKYFDIYWLGASTAYSLIKSQTRTNGRKKMFRYLKRIPEGSTVMLFFGEVDCRVHLVKQARRRNKSFEYIVEECVSRYFSVILEIIAMGFYVVVFNVIPSTLSKNCKKVPVYGNYRDRNKISDMFNKSLSELCKDKCVFISVFDRFINKKFKIRTSYYRDAVHLGAAAYPIVVEEMNKLVKGFDY